MKTLIDRVRRLTLNDYAVVAEVVMLAVTIELALRCVSFARVQKWFAESRVANPESRIPNPGSRIPHPELYHRLARFTAAAYRVLPFPATCLRQSLVLCALLNRRGTWALLRMGVVKEGSALKAHAWVECDGIDSAADSPFRPLHRVADVASEPSLT